MSVWDRYPSHYRSGEVQAILRAVQSGESAAVWGLSGSGKSNLLGFLAGRGVERIPGVSFVLVDCNRIQGPLPAGLFRLALRSLGAAAPREGEPDLEQLAQAVDGLLRSPEAVLCLLLDRFDVLMEPGDVSLFSQLRALRDDHRYRLTYVIASRRPIPPHNELAELFSGRSFWLGPLSPEDALWSAQEYARRSGTQWEAADLAAILEFSGRYPSFLRAVCQAAADGVPLLRDDLLACPAVRGRLDEFWADEPTEEMLRESGLSGHPLLTARGGPPAAELTAKEKRLLDALKAVPGQVCEKDELIGAVWPEDQVYGQGLRDDSLAQLVRRLREKIELDPSHPRQILTVPGRGYRYHPE